MRADEPLDADLEDFSWFADAAGTVYTVEERAPVIRFSDFYSGGGVSPQAALERALSSAFRRYRGGRSSGGIVWLDESVELETTLYIPHHTRLVGDIGREINVLRAAPGFSDEALVVDTRDVDYAENITYQCGLRNLGLDLNGSQAIGFFSERMNEGCGLENVFMIDLRNSGVKVANGAASATGSIDGTVLTIIGDVKGTIKPGARIDGTSIPAGMRIRSQIAGPEGGIGTYEVNTPASVAPTALSFGGFVPQNFRLRNLELLIAADASGVSAIDIDLAYANWSGLDGLTVNRMAELPQAEVAALGGCCILLDRAPGSNLANLNLEGMSEGVVMASRGGQSATIIDNINGNGNVTNLVRIHGDHPSSYNIRGLNKAEGLNALVDDRKSLTIATSPIASISRDDAGRLFFPDASTDNEIPRLVVTSCKVVEQEGVGALRTGFRSASTSKTINAGSQADFVFELESLEPGSPNFSGEIAIGCTRILRFAEKRMIGGTVSNITGEVLDVQTTPQQGNSRGALSIGAPQPVGAGVPYKFRITVSNNSTYDADITLVVPWITVGKGQLVSIT